MSNNMFDLNESDFIEDRYNRLKLIPWWDQLKLSKAAIMVVGAGALGNELVKNIALLGIGKILVVDMDRIERANLTRTILFRESDLGKFKSVVAAEKACEINPDIKTLAIIANIISDVGLGVFRRINVVLGGLDNREARLAINQACYKVNKPWIDGAIEALDGIARVFIPPDGPCYECTMTNTDWKQINIRKSCALLSREKILEGRIPTTPTSSSIIAGIQVQEMLKLLHSDRKLPTLAGKGFVFNGLSHDSYLVEYQRKPGCMSHDGYSDVVEMPWSVRTVTLREFYNAVVEDLGDGAMIEFDRDIAASAKCSCGYTTKLFRPVNKLTGSDLACVKCNATMNYESFHNVSGNENFLDKTLFEIGVPLFHIVGARKGNIYRYFEFTNDMVEVLGSLSENSLS